MTGLLGRRVMVVEDNYLLAMEVKLSLQASGAQVIGPFATVDHAQRSLRHGVPDCAVLDVNLGEGASFDLARTLRRREIPFVFFTGYDANALPAEFGNVERVEKPVDAVRLKQAVERCCQVSSPTRRDLP